MVDLPHPDELRLIPTTENCHEVTTAWNSGSVPQRKHSAAAKPKNRLKTDTRGIIRGCRRLVIAFERSLLATSEGHQCEEAQAEQGRETGAEAAAARSGAAVDRAGRRLARVGAE